MPNSVIWFIASIVATVLIECQGQFRIVGLLNEDSGANLTMAHQTNAQPRGFSDILEAEVAARESSVQANMIKVHLMDQEKVDSDIFDGESRTEDVVAASTEVTTMPEKVKPIKIAIRPIIITESKLFLKVIVC